MASFVAVCAFDPGPDTACPTGSMMWAPESNFAALPELSTAETAQLMGAFLTLFACAVGIRFIIKQFIK